MKTLVPVTIIIKIIKIIIAASPACQIARSGKIACERALAGACVYRERPNGARAFRDTQAQEGGQAQRRGLAAHLLESLLCSDLQLVCTRDTDFSDFSESLQDSP